MMVKRIFDTMLSLFLLFIFSPLFAIISILISIDSKGSVFFRQNRVGLNGCDFHIIKFRTMYSSSKPGALITSGSTDSRITRIGIFLRKYKLDELPQLFNVLLNQMSFVGPRPEVRKYVEMYDETQLLVLSVKPGITDIASIMYSEEAKLFDHVKDDIEYFYISEIMPAKLKLNLEYLENRSFFRDLGIIFRTLKKIVGHS